MKSCFYNCCYCGLFLFRFAILSTTECKCSNVIIDTAVDSRICTAVCPNNPSQICGGLDAESYYDTDIKGIYFSFVYQF